MKTNDETRLLRMISGLSKRIDALQRTSSQNAFLYATNDYTYTLTANTETMLLFLQQVRNQGIIGRINSGDTGTFTVMSSGVYLISVNLFLSPSVTDAQLRLSIQPADTLGFTQWQQINMVGSLNRTAMGGYIVQYFNEGDTFYVSAITPTDTTVTLRPEFGDTPYKSPYISITQLTSEYDVVNSANDWYGDDSDLL